MAAALTACHQNPFLTEWDTPYGIPPFDKIQNSDYMPAILKGIELQNAEIQAIVDNPEAPDFENTVAAFDRSGLVLEKVSNVLFNLSESDYTEELNAIVEEATPIVSEHSDNLMMNPGLFARVKAVYEADRSGLDREQQMLLKDLYEGFIKNGIGLDEQSQARLREINSELSKLVLSFGNNLLAESNAYKAELGQSVANYYDNMASEPDRAKREKMFRMYSMRGNNGNGNDNKANILRIMELRIEKAHLLGFGSFEGVKRAKGQLYDFISGNCGEVFVNVDDENLKEMSAARSGLTIIPYGLGYSGAAVLAPTPENPYLRIDMGGRFGRGRNYAMSGQVVEVKRKGEKGKSQVVAKVQGVRDGAYEVTVDFRAASAGAKLPYAAKILELPASFDGDVSAWQATGSLKGIRNLKFGRSGNAVMAMRSGFAVIVR